MNSTKRKRRLVFALILIGFVCAGIALYAAFGDEEGPRFEELNAHLDVDGIGFGMPEDQVVAYWGEGTLVKGYGGHFRRYADRSVDVSFSDDAKSACYQSICSISSANPDYRMYDIGIQDEMKAAEERLKTYGFEHIDGHLFKRERIVVSLSGQDRVERVQVAYAKPD